MIRNDSRPLSVSSRIDYIYHFCYPLLVRFQICIMYVLSWSTTSELKPVNGFETIWGACTPHTFAVRTGWSFPALQWVSDNVFAYRCDIVTVSRIPPILPVLFPLLWLFFLVIRETKYHLTGLDRIGYYLVVGKCFDLSHSGTGKQEQTTFTEWKRQGNSYPIL